VNNHYKRFLFQNESEVKTEKTNLLMVGPTSSGKTLLIKILQKIMAKSNIPVAFADATSLTEAGYVGDDVDSIVLRLLQEADFNVEKAQKGIIFIDEIDKVALKAGGGSISRDVSGEGVQQALLGILQGKTVFVSPQGGRRNPSQEQIPINTSEILFICAGAFCGLKNIIHERNNIDVVGFHGGDNTQKKKESYEIETEDLINFGMIPEFIGRLPVVAQLDELTHAQLVEILHAPKNSLIKQYENLFSINDAQLIFTHDALDAIAQIAIKKKVSARGLHAVIKNVLQETMFELEDHAPCKVIVDRNAVLNKRPIIEKMLHAESVQL
jgi:ATP-dependent Clp protease ATP-binding subunit ClpX